MIQSALSDFENQVLKLYLEGADYVQISEKLDRSVKSIDNALQRIRQKVKACVTGTEKPDDVTRNYCNFRLTSVSDFVKIINRSGTLRAAVAQ